MKTNASKRKVGIEWWGACFMAPLVIFPLARAINVPPLAAPWLVVALLAPFFAIHARRVWQDGERQKHVLQEKFDFEDAALLGKQK